MLDPHFCQFGLFLVLGLFPILNLLSSAYYLILVPTNPPPISLQPKACYILATLGQLSNMRFQFRLHLLLHHSNVGLFAVHDY